MITDPLKTVDTEIISDMLDSVVNKLELKLLEFIVQKNRPLTRNEEFLDFLETKFPPK